MEALIFLVVAATLIVLLINNSNISAKLNNLLREVEYLRETLYKIEKQGISPKTKEEPKPVPQPAKPVEKASEPVLKSEPVAVPEPKPAAPMAEHVTSSYQDTIKAKMEAMSLETPPKKPEPVQPAVPVAPKPPKQPTDFEKFIGENLISKLGIIILVLGVGFFVKYAIDQQWIGVYGRTAIGLVTGGILISLAHYLRKSFKTFSSLLTGGGFAVFYLTIAIAFHQYHIFSQTSAFVIMVVITIFSVLLSLAYDKKELAIFSQLGGYAAPFMLSTGEGNYVVLFSYLLILNAGLLILAYYKRWHILNLLAFIFTLILFTAWLPKAFWGKTNPPYGNAMLFATAFYLVFFLVNILNNIKERKPFKAVEIMMILSNNLFFFLWGMFILHDYEKGIYKGLFTVLAALFNFGWVVYLYRLKQVDKSLIYLLIGLVMSYISLAVPIQLNGHSITLFWTAELVILLWLSQVSGIKILRIGHLIILSLVIISLAMDWGNLYTQKALPVIFNQAFITGIFVIAGLVGANFLLNREKDQEFVNYVFSVHDYKNVLAVLLLLATFIIPFIELIYQVSRFYPDGSFQIVVASVYILAYLFTVMLITRAPKWETVFSVIFVISLVSLLLYITVYQISVTDIRFTLMFTKTITTGNFLFHYLALPFVGGILYLLNKKQAAVLSGKGNLPSLLIWFTSFVIVFIASAELDNILILTSATSDNYYSILEMSHKVGYPILWGICAFVLISLGIKFKKKIFRIQALSLFGLILLKLFLFDVWSMSKGGRIATLVFLGIVLLVVSFLYQKLKNLLLDSNETNDNSGL